MKKYLLLIVSFLLISCKTINVPENQAFMETKYNYNEYKKNIENSKEITNKTEFLEVLNDLVNTDKISIQNKELISISRNLYPIKSDGINLEYVEFTPKNFSKVGIYFSGNGSNILDTYQVIEKIAINSNAKIYVLHYRGYGKSGGTPSFKTSFSDNQKFYNFIKEKESKINFAIGYSLGSVSATYLATDNQIDNLVLMSPFSNTKQTFSHLKKAYLKGFKFVLRPFVKLTAEKYLMEISNSEKIKNYTGKLLLLHGNKDEMLPYKMSKDLYANAATTKKELITIENGGHGSAFENQYLDKIIEFIK